MSTPAKTCRVGILIPVFNGAATIAETLESLQRQDELGELTGLYVADNASTDDTVRIARSVWTSNPPLTILSRRQNEDQWPNVNGAFRELSDRLDWVLILHADDLAKPTWLGVMMERIQTCPDRVSTICCSWDDFFPDGTIRTGENDPARPDRIVHGHQAAIRHTLLAGCWWHITGCAIRMQAFDDVGEFNVELKQQGDWEWLLRCFERSWDAEYIAQALILYRQHASSISTASFRENRDINDSLKIVALYGDALSFRERLRFHGRLLSFCTQRVGRALTSANFAQARCTLRTAAIVVSSSLHNL